MASRGEKPQRHIEGKLTVSSTSFDFLKYRFQLFRQEEDAPFSINKNV